MKYLEYYNYLTEGWKTYVPSNNPKVLLYDFYVLSYLSTLPLGPEQKGFSGNLIGRTSHEIKLDIEHAQSLLLPVLVKKLKNALFFAVCAEIQHLFDRAQDYTAYKNNKLLKYYTRYFHDLIGRAPHPFKPRRDIKNPRVTGTNTYYLTSYKAAMMAIKKSGSSTTAFADLASELFTKMDWSSSYGGKKWTEIAEGYLLLVKATSNNQKQVAIDHAYDLQHNTGTALNKVSDFAIDNSFEWLTQALDHKRDAKSMYELLPNCSSDMKKLALEAFKVSGVMKPEVKADPANASDLNFKLGDTVMYSTSSYTIYGRIIDKHKILSESDSHFTSKFEYKILITRISGAKPPYLNIGQTYDITHDKVMYMSKVVGGKYTTNASGNASSNNTLVKAGEIYDVTEYGCFFKVDSVSAASQPHTEVATGRIVLIHNLTDFKKLQDLSPEILYPGSEVALHTEYLHEGDIELYKAKDSAGNQLIVGNEYSSFKMGVVIQLTEIRPNPNIGTMVHTIRGKIIDIINKQVHDLYYANLKIGDIAYMYNNLSPVTGTGQTQVSKELKFKVGDSVLTIDGAVKGTVIAIDTAEGDNPFYEIKITDVDTTKLLFKPDGWTVGADISFYETDLELNTSDESSKFKVGDKYILSVPSGNKYEVVLLKINLDLNYPTPYQVKITKVLNGVLSIGNVISTSANELTPMPGRKFKPGDNVFFESPSGTKYEAIVIGKGFSFGTQNTRIKITKVIQGALNVGNEMNVDPDHLTLMPKKAKEYNPKVGDKVKFVSPSGNEYEGIIESVLPTGQGGVTLKITKVIKGTMNVGSTIKVYVKELTLIDRNAPPESFTAGDDVTWTGETGNKYEAVVVGPGTLTHAPSKKIKITKVISKASGGQPMSVGSTPSVYDKSLKHITLI